MTATGGSPSENFNIDISGAGFLFRPDTGLISAGTPLFDVAYYPGNGSTNLNAIVTLSTRDGSNLAAGSHFDLNGEFTEFA